MLTRPPERRRSRRAAPALALLTAVALVGHAGATAASTTDVTALPIVASADGDLTLTWPSDRVTDVPATPTTLTGPTARALRTDQGYELRAEPRTAIDASEVAAGAAEGGRLRVRITDVDGPGELALATAGLDGDRVATSVDADSQLHVAAGRVTPTTWTVTEPGRYDVTLEVAATRPGGGATVAEGTVALRVVPETPAPRPSPRADGSEAQPTPDAGTPDEGTRAPEAEPSPSSAQATTEEDPATTAAAPDGSETAEGEDDAVSTRSSVTASQGDRLILDVGHVDAFEVSLSDGQLVVQLKDDTFLHADQVVYRDPSEVLFQVLPQAATEVPDNPDFAFLGDPGDTVHLLPLTQDPELLWPGWSTERMSSSQVDGPVQLRITDVSGPGHLKLFTSSTFGGNQVLVDSEDGLPDAWNVNVPAHVHANWAFTSTGAYTLTVDASATLADGTDVTTGPVVYHWHVGDLDDDGGSGGGDGDGSDGDGDGGADGDGSDAGDDGGDGAAGDGSGDGSGSGGGSLAQTGADASDLALLSLLLLALGGAVLRRQRRRTVASTT